MYSTLHIRVSVIINVGAL